MILAGTLVLVLGMAASISLSAAGLSNRFVFFGFMAFVGLGNGMIIPSATTGMLSVRPHLAGTASGLGGAIQIGFGALLAATAGAILGPGSTEMPLLILMFLTGCAGLAAILLVALRERQLRRMGRPTS